MPSNRRSKSIRRSSSAAVGALLPIAVALFNSGQLLLGILVVSIQLGLLAASARRARQS